MLRVRRRLPLLVSHRRTLDEEVACQQGGFERIFPSSVSWQLYRYTGYTMSSTVIPQSWHRSFLTDTSGQNRQLQHALYPAA